jgi:hypothetical protein
MSLLALATLAVGRRLHGGPLHFSGIDASK